ncbi:von Willebrand factor type A domain protein [Rubripirellula lacrimiformis]|uniref:von Willebrand factor type A domain protein n=1 Tax=Rubripirellula lacrimiformis TaxID=1930273 RepID=A0A517NBY9_9BACT|nr:vWA domain-containing protein [Rubripirellula lacrimiformis]QDT04659.1 von Willebrand factor type A domain protein [Rubripirellula lacrimiformis]
MMQLEMTAKNSIDSTQTQRRSGIDRRGAMMVLIVVMMIGFMVAVAFSVDIAQMHLSRTELRTATDAASKAAAATLAESLDQDAAIAEGQRIAAANTVNGEPLLLDGSDFVFGSSNQEATGKFAFTEGGLPRNSVLVNGRRTTGSRSGPVPLFFGNVFGVPFFEPATSSTATYIERDIVLVVDRSGSMAGSKFGNLVTAIDTFVATLDGTPVDEAVGLASYSEFATEDVALTEDLTQISDGIRDLSVGGFTSISRGLQAGANVMSASAGVEFVEQTYIIMTDGRHNRGPEPRTVATAIAGPNVTIHTITFGSDADATRMAEVASIGGGRHFHADSGLELIEVYREIALTLSTMMTQ